MAMDKALSVNMSRDVVERAIKKATGELEGVEYEEIRYEGYAPGGIAVIVDCMTDNKVRTVADIMSSPPVTASPSDTVAEASKAMQDRRVGSVVVVGSVGGGGV